MEIGSQITYLHHPHMSPAESRIVGKLLDDVLAAGYSVSAYEGGDWAIEDSTDKLAIFKALASTDRDELRLKGVIDNIAIAGWVLLIWGNDVDVISDYTTNIEAIVAGANALAEELSNG